EIDTSIGNFIVKEIQEINLYPENQFEAKFDTHLKFSNRNKIKITVYLKGDIKFYKINNFLGAKNIEITQTLFHEQAIPLSNKMIKAINRQIRKHLPTNLFYKNDIHFVSEFTKDYIESFETDFDKIKIHFRLFRSKKGYY
ncbi:hypothetical protein, partial [Oleiphilus sp. HI0123]|uniref:hypothetical protein n=1 Tax=Oleiphilus sp. HI0123 TaxID=1822265 RepID=UPI000AD925B9